jgi:hypothetical protein
VVRLSVGVGMLAGLLGSLPAWGQGFPTENSRVEYTHLTQSGRPCRFEIGAKGGEADYYWNGQRTREKLEPAGQVKGMDVVYNVYKVAGRNMWFFFGVNPVKTASGTDYPMRYSMRGPQLDGSVAIVTSGPTKLREFELKPSAGTPKPPEPGDKGETDK